MQDESVIDQGSVPFSAGEEGFGEGEGEEEEQGLGGGGHGGLKVEVQVCGGLWRWRVSRPNRM